MFKVIKVKEDKDKHGYPFFWIFFRNLSDGRSARTCVVPGFGNYNRWKWVIDKVRSGEEVFLKGLSYLNRKQRLIDADSIFLPARPTELEV